MSRITSLEKELNHLAKQRQQREECLLGTRTAAKQATARSPSASSSSSSSASSSSESGSSHGDGEEHPHRHHHHHHHHHHRQSFLGGSSAHNSTSNLHFSSPSSTGSRFDLLMEGGGPCKRSEVRKATAATATSQRQKSKNTGSHGYNSGLPLADGRRSDANADSKTESTSVGAAPPVGSSVTPITIPTHAPYRRLLPQPFSHILVCDFEATCESGSVSYPHEIIEFPAVVLDTATLQVVAEFHEFVRPVKNPKLTRFCTELTGITQETVDAADPLPVVVERFSQWLREVLYPLCRSWRAQRCPEGATSATTGGAGVDYCPALSHNLRSEQKRFTYDDSSDAARAYVPEEKMVCFATDGPWDMRRFMLECSVLRDGVEFPPLFYRYINVRHSFCEHFKSRQIKLTHMLKKLNMSFEGQRHSGIADTRNIARVLAELLARGYRVHHVSAIKYSHRGDAFLASNQAARELLEEYGEDDDDNRAKRNGGRNGNSNHHHNTSSQGDSRKALPRNRRKNPAGAGTRRK